MKIIHEFLFEDLYSWAGEFRTIDIYKNEVVIGGLSVIYSQFACIERDLIEIFKWSTTIDWTHDNPQLFLFFSKFMADIWRVHPYREGNTRTVSIFMKLFSDQMGLQFTAELLSKNAAYLRNALVMAADNEAPDPTYLHRIITDALSSNSSNSIPKSKQHEEYRKIGHYDVANYEERPFETKIDE